MSQANILNILKDPYVQQHGITIDELCDRLYRDDPQGGPSHPHDSARVMISRLKSKGYKITNQFIGRGNKAAYRLSIGKEALTLGLRYAREAHRLAGMTLGHLSQQLDPTQMEEAKTRYAEIAEHIRIIETEINAV
jgi:hypothetical protein